MGECARKCERDCEKIDIESVWGRVTGGKSELEEYTISGIDVLLKWRDTPDKTGSYPINITTDI